MREDTGIAQFTFMFISCILGCMCHTAGLVVAGIADRYPDSSVWRGDTQAALMTFSARSALAELFGATVCYHAARAIDQVAEGIYINKHAGATKRVQPH